MQFLKQKHGVESKKKFSCTRGLKNACIQFKEFYFPPPRQPKQNYLQNVLLLRAWVLHFSYIGMRLMYLATGRSIWLETKTSCFNLEGELDMDKNLNDCVPQKFNEELLERMGPVKRNLVYVVLFMSLTLDILIFKWRKLANLLLYAMLIDGFFMALSPAKEMLLTEFHIVSAFLIVIMAMYTNSRAQIIVLSLMHCLITFVNLHFVMMQELTINSVVIKVFLIVALFFMNSSLALLVKYVNGLHERIKVSNFESVKLLDGMHEGLLILSRDNQKICSTMFCNFSAQKLLVKAIESYEHHRIADLDRPNFLSDQQRVMQHSLFERVKFDSNGHLIDPSTQNNMDH